MFSFSSYLPVLPQKPSAWTFRLSYKALLRKLADNSEVDRHAEVLNCRFLHTENPSKQLDIINRTRNNIHNPWVIARPNIAYIASLFQFFVSRHVSNPASRWYSWGISTWHPLRHQKDLVLAPGPKKGEDLPKKVPKTEGGKSISLEFLKTPPLSLCLYAVRTIKWNWIYCKIYAKPKHVTTTISVVIKINSSR